MLKLNTLLDMDDHQVPGSNDLRYEGGVAPSKHFASLDHGNETATATHSVLVMDRPRDETVIHHTALPDGGTTSGLLQPPR